MKREKRHSIFKLLIAFSLIVTIFQGCNPIKNNPLAEYEKKIKDYYIEKLNDPKSYEAIKTDVLYSNNSRKVLKHSYRAKNSYNAVVKTTSYFITDGNSILYEIDNIIYSAFNDLIDKEVIVHTYDSDFFLSMGISRVEGHYRLNNNIGKEEFIHQICNIISELKNQKAAEAKTTLERYYGVRFTILFDLIQLFPNEMAATLIDSY